MVRPTVGYSLLTGSEDLADAISAHFDPIVRANLRQWFWITDLELDAAFPEIVTRRAAPQRKAVST